MTSSHFQWQVVSWSRFDKEPPALSRGTIKLGDETLEVHEPLDPAWEMKHLRRGAEIHDERRGLTYRATLNPETLELDHLEIVPRGPFTKPNGEYGDFERLRSIPLERIHSVVRAHVISERGAGSQVTVFTLPGGLADDGDGSMRKPPPSEQIAKLMRPVTEGGLGLDRRGVAAHYGRNQRTVDRWITRARQELPGLMPPARGINSRKNPGAPAPDQQ
ncbi:hypothetical protein JOF28_000539 [Leucobacter exalbidus]|uniref:Uncharacterized protein n=1 Tax=Leucobacter exalbidus TaxID=662960 RepID=A0A940T2P9_9MICO|nr:hypothetical protein [Leucobacter exalbidus]MBP1325307.1 hypothetical protein [Leucobacter exalbidus]